MDKSKIIAQIEENKQGLNLKFRLKKETERFTDLLYLTLFDVETSVENNLNDLFSAFQDIIAMACKNENFDCHKLWDEYVQELPLILKKLREDARCIEEGDPASLSVEEVYMAYPGFYAIAIYRLAHELYSRGLPLVPRLMTEYAHRQTGVDINPGAQIGSSFFIDHATGVVIGETAIIKDHVKIYQGVTLGALYVAKELRKTKRHPTIENHVTIYANATILGGETVIGENSVIGGNAWITASVPANSTVFHTPEIKIKTQTHA